MNTIFKKDIINHCKTVIKDKVNLCQKLIDEAQKSSNEDTKSSAGDKYETSRAMAQQVMDLNLNQKKVLDSDLMILNRINPDLKLEIIGLGSIFKTDKNFFWIGIGLGTLVINDVSIIAISPNAPLAKEFMGKKLNDKVIFNSISHQILDLY